MLLRNTSFSAPANDTVRWRLRLAGKLEKFYPRDMDKLMSDLRIAADDDDLFPLRLAAGSVMLDIAGRPESIARLQHLHRSGALSRLLQRNVLSTEQLSWPSPQNVDDARANAPSTDCNLTANDSTLLKPSADYNPVLFVGIQEHHPQNKPFEMDVAFSQSQSEHFIEDASASLHYFMEALSVPPVDIWVNLGPGETDRAMGARLRGLEIGRVLLELDLTLKQLASSFLHPTSEVGTEYWRKVSEAFLERDGHIPHRLEPHIRLWIEPKWIKMLETADGTSAVITDATLGLQGEEAHMTGHKASGTRAGVRPATADDELYWQVFSKIALPEIARELNHGKHFAKNRQVLRSLTLASWFRTVFRDDPRYVEHLSHPTQPEVHFKFAWTHRPVPYSPAEWRRPGDPPDRPLSEIVNAANTRTYAEYQRAFNEGICFAVQPDNSKTSQPMMVRSFFSGAIDCTGRQYSALQRLPPEIAAICDSDRNASGRVGL